MRASLSLVCLIVTAISLSCNTFRPLKRGQNEQSHHVLPEARLLRVQNVITHLFSRNFEAAQDELSELYRDSEVGEDPVLEGIVGVNQLLLNNPERAMYHLKHAVTLVDSGHIFYAKKSLTTKTEFVNEQTVDSAPVQIQEDAKIVAAFKEYVRRNKQAGHVIDLLKQRSRIIPHPPTFLGPSGLVFEVIEDNFSGKSYFSPLIPDYPRTEGDVSQLRQVLAVNMIIAGIMLRDVASVREARNRLLSSTSHPDNLTRFHLGFSGYLIDAPDYKQYLLFRERELFK